MTPEEKELLINEITERMLLRLPDIISNLVSNQAEVERLRFKFLKDHPEYREHRDKVIPIIEELEGKNPHLKYEKILDKAVPEITRRLGTLKQLNMSKVEKPSRMIKGEF